MLAEEIEVLSYFNNYLDTLRSDVLPTKIHHNKGTDCLIRKIQSLFMDEFTQWVRND